MAHVLWDRLAFGRRRRARRMMRRLRELDRYDAAVAAATRATPHRASLGSRLLAALLLVTILSLGGVMVVSGRAGLPGLDVFDDTSPATAQARETGRGSFRFIASQTGRPDTPVTYNPCRDIDVLVNDEQAPAGSEDLVQQALTRISEATGMSFRYRGTTDAKSANATSPLSSERYSQPVLVDWSNPDESPSLAGRTVGTGGSAAETSVSTGRARYIAGTVLLDSPGAELMLAQRNGRDLVRAVLLHELAHVSGLDHVDDPRQLMFKDNVGLTDFGAGDLAGLRMLGRGSCESWR